MPDHNAILNLAFATLQIATAVLCLAGGAVPAATLAAAAAALHVWMAWRG